MSGSGQITSQGQQPASQSWANNSGWLENTMSNFGTPGTAGVSANPSASMSPVTGSNPAPMPAMPSSGGAPIQSANPVLSPASPQMTGQPIVPQAPPSPNTPPGQMMGQPIAAGNPTLNSAGGVTPPPINGAPIAPIMNNGGNPSGVSGVPLQGPTTKPFGGQQLNSAGLPISPPIQGAPPMGLLSGMTPPQPGVGAGPISFNQGYGTWAL